VGIDVGVELHGWYGDAARTFAVGDVSEEASRLMRVTEESLAKGLARARAGNRVGDISHAVQSHVERHGFSVVRELVGHGIGSEMHEEPAVTNYVQTGARSMIYGGSELGVGTVAQCGPGSGDRADGERRRARRGDALRRLDGGDEGRPVVGALRAHRRGGSGRPRDPLGAAGREVSKGVRLAKEEGIQV